MGNLEVRSQGVRRRVLGKASILLNHLPPYSSTTNEVYFVLKTTGMVK